MKYKDFTSILIKNTPSLLKMLIPKRCSNDYGAEYLRKLAYDGLKQRIPDEDKRKRNYNGRLDYELYLIGSNNAREYILIVYDFISWAKKRGILIGPGKASSPSSLVCYCLGITDVDPVKYGLISERFLPYSGGTVDIDVTVDLSRKQELVDYIVEKYNGCYIVPDNEDDLIAFEEFEKDCGFQQAMKFDIFGYQILSVLKNVETEIQKENKNFSLIQIPLDDEKTFETLSNGTFDISNQSISNDVLQLIKPKTFEELADVVALSVSYAGELLSDYVNKNQRFNIPGVNEILKSTNGVLLYQEQILMILFRCFGFDLDEEALHISRVMRVRRKSEFEDTKKAIICAGLKYGYNSIQINDFIETLYKYACWTYPKSHALCESKLVYWEAYIKRHYPEFCCLEQLKMDSSI